MDFVCYEKRLITCSLAICALRLVSPCRGGATSAAVPWSTGLHHRLYVSWGRYISSGAMVYGTASSTLCVVGEIHQQRCHGLRDCIIDFMCRGGDTSAAVPWSTGLHHRLYVSWGSYISSGAMVYGTASSTLCVMKRGLKMCSWVVCALR